MPNEALELLAEDRDELKESLEEDLEELNEKYDIDNIELEVTEKLLQGLGIMHGGMVGSLVDTAIGSAVFGALRGKGRVVTIAVDAMSFHEPVEVGDEVSCYAQINRTGRTSITVDIEAWKRKKDSTSRTKVTEGVFTYVKIDARRRPQPLPPT